MKTGSLGTSVLTCIALLLALPFPLSARPRPPLPPMPEMAPLLFRAEFDEPLGATNARPESFHPAYTDLVESWSGYALHRAGDSVTPLLIPALAADGRANIACASGAVRFWFKPDWSSASLPDAKGPGVEARLIELTAVGTRSTVVVWSLSASPNGTALHLTGITQNGLADLLTARIEWRAGQWHLLVLNSGPQGTALFVDGELVAEGRGVQTAPPDLAVVSVGSTVAGHDPAGGEFDKACAFARPLTANEARFSYDSLKATAALGSISPEEEAAQLEAVTKSLAGKTPPAPTPMRMVGIIGSNNCDTSGPVRLTNVVCTFATHGVSTVTFDLMGGTSGLIYDIFTSTNLAGTNIANSPWRWLERGPTCRTYKYTNQPGVTAFYVVGTPQDTDDDGQPDAFEQLVSKSDPTVGVNHIQTENTITGTTNWMLFNPITTAPTVYYVTNVSETNLTVTTNTYYRSWPAGSNDSFPEIEGFASATSVNLGESLTFYVDMRDGSSNFTCEIFRLGWYGGLGGRQMKWSDTNATARTNVVLPAAKQPVPGINPTNGLIDCLLSAPANPNGPWQSSYSLTIPTNWVSGVYVAKLTTGTNVTPQNTGKQSYIIFVVRDDGHAADHLYQASVTTWQAYNPWGGSSLYGNIPSAAPEGSAVSFNRPYGFYTGCLSNTIGVGAGDFITLFCGDPSWEYNMVRWLERQGYDVTYCSNIDTHRNGPAAKRIKAFLSVGHDEYWSEPMRSHVEAARDLGVNLGFFGANACFWRIHFDAGERVFRVDKNSLSGAYDLWRGSFDNDSGDYPAEASMIGVEYVFNSLAYPDDNMAMANPLATNPVVGGIHWAYVSGSLASLCS